MLKKEQELREFQAAFSFLEGGTAILYGTGQYTELLAGAPLPFRLIGLMDRNRTGGVFCGLPVLGEEEVRRSGCKTMILAANLSSAPQIYRRIRDFAQDCGITVYYMNGRNPAEEPTEIVPPSDWAWSKEALLAKAMEYDVVSFDLFDTLIARKCLLPEAVFSIVERRARNMGVILDDFVFRRQEAERALYHGGKPWHQLDDIYEWLCRAYGISPDCAKRLRQMELDVELELIRPREDMVFCYAKLLEQGRHVIVTSDMYLTGTQLAPLLHKCGIENAEILVSNECKSSKHLGTLFQTLRERFPGKRILHIGDNPRCDVENARKNGVGARLVPSAAAWMEACGLGNLKTASLKVYELFAQRCFSSAFPLDSAQKRILISRPEDVGYLFFGPLAVGYLAWLAERLPEQGIDRILMVSRDGYLFCRLYQRIQKHRGGLPRADYFLTSRRCAGTASLKSGEDVRFLFESVCYSRDMRFGEMLGKIFGLASGRTAPAADCTLGELGWEEAWKRLERGYLRQILDRAAEERERYLRYIGSLGLSGERIGMMNFVGRGVTQRCLQSILGKGLTGFYFALECDSAHILNSGEALSWYPERLSTHTGRRKLAEQLLLGETVFSAPCGAVVNFSKSGDPVYEETAKERAALVQGCHRGILEYLEDVLTVNGGLEGFAEAVDAADGIFGLLPDGRFRLSGEIRAGFRFEDRFDGMCDRK